MQRYLVYVRDREEAFGVAADDFTVESDVTTFHLGDILKATFITRNVVAIVPDYRSY